jgi:hypothetical protein
VLQHGGLVRYEHELAVAGVLEFRRSIGLDAPAGEPGAGDETSH